MNFFRTLLVGLTIVTAIPAHGMWQDIKNSIGWKSGLTEETKAFIAASYVTGMAQVMYHKVFNPDPCMVQMLADKPLQAGSTITFLGIGIPLLFYMSLKNNPNFWNQEGFCNRALLAFNAYMSGLAVANLYQVF